MSTTTVNVTSIHAYLCNKVKLNLGGRKKNQPGKTERTTAMMPGKKPQTSATTMMARV
jgi:hypothetical protein